MPILVQGICCAGCGTPRKSLDDNRWNEFTCEVCGLVNHVEEIAPPEPLSMLNMLQRARYFIDHDEYDNAKRIVAELHYHYPGFLEVEKVENEVTILEILNNHEKSSSLASGEVFDAILTARKHIALGVRSQYIENATKLMSTFVYWFGETKDAYWIDCISNASNGYDEKKAKAIGLMDYFTALDELTDKTLEIQSKLNEVNEEKKNVDLKNAAISCDKKIIQSYEMLEEERLKDHTKLWTLSITGLLFIMIIIGCVVIKILFLKVCLVLGLVFIAIAEIKSAEDHLCQMKQEKTDLLGGMTVDDVRNNLNMHNEELQKVNERYEKLNRQLAQLNSERASLKAKVKKQKKNFIETAHL